VSILLVSTVLVQQVQEQLPPLLPIPLTLSRCTCRPSPFTRIYHRVQTKIQVRSEIRYHGLLRTIHTIWKVSYSDIVLHLRFTEHSSPATWHCRLFRRCLSPIITQSSQLRHRMGGLRRCPHVHMDLNLLSCLHRTALHSTHEYCF
jgi:hypothetical protein